MPPEYVTKESCESIHESTCASIDRLTEEVKALSNRLYKDNGTISIQTRLDRQSHAIEELQKHRFPSRDTQAGIAKEESCSEFGFGPFRWKIRGKDATVLFMTLVWRLFALGMMAYIALTLRGVDIGVIKAAAAAKENTAILEHQK